MSSLEEIRRAAFTAFPISSTFLFFDQALTVLHSHECSPTHQELVTLRDAFGERDAAIQRGMHLAGRRFEIHRHHPPLVYGRQMVDTDPEEGPGIAACKIESSVLGTPCYAVLTYQ
ncbi:hypothetical protein Ndes2526B_g03354 [Nannochloris sp. 'desiccata']